MIAAAIARLPVSRRVFWGALLIGVVTCGLYLRTVRYPLLFWDDDENILQNPLVVSPGIAGLKQLFTQPFSTDFYPVTYLSLALDHWLWRGALPGYHLTQILLHSVNAVLVVLLVWRWTRRAGVALAAGSWFAWHPLQVETVAWLAERKSVLGTGLMLLAWLAWLRAEDCLPEPARDNETARETLALQQPAWRASVPRAAPKAAARWRLGSLALFTLAVLSHALVLVMPGLLLAYELGLRRTRWATAVRRTWLFFLPAIFSATMRVLGHGESGQLNQQFPSVTTGVLTMVTVFGNYLGTLFWPAHLSNYYVVRLVGAATDPRLWPAAAWLLGWLAVCWRAPKLRRWSGFAALWFLVALAPVCQLVPHPTVRADRYLYVAAIAVFALVALLLAQRRWLLAGLGPVIAAALLALTIARIPDWRDGRTLWTDCLKKQPRAAVAWYSLAGFDIHDGRWPDAETRLRHATELNPGFAEAHARLGAVLLVENKTAAARAELERALALNPGLVEARRNLAAILSKPAVIERSP